MPIYQYSGITAQDEPRSGTLEAINSRIARETLGAQGLQLDSLTLKELVLEIAEPAAPGETSTDGDFRPRLTTAEAYELTSHLSQLLKANLPLAPGLRALSEELPDRRLAQTFSELAARLETGMPLESAIGATASRLPPYVRGLLSAGLSSGRYQEALEDFLQHERAANAVRHRLRLTLSYSGFLLCITGIWFFVVLYFLVPPFLKVFRDFKVRLPVLTVALGQISNVRSEILVATLVLLALAVLAWRFAGRVGVLSKLLDWMPLIGPVWRYGALTRFSNLLAVLLDQGVPLPAALELTATGVDHAALAEACRDVARRTAKGEPLAESMADLAEFPHILLPLVAWGQRLSAVPEALKAAATLFRSRAEQRAPLAAMILPLLTFLTIVFTFFFVILGLFLPLIRLVTALS